jgi:hypothetical protein
MVDLCGRDAKNRGKKCFTQRHAGMSGIEEEDSCRTTYAWEQRYNSAKRP